MVNLPFRVWATRPFGQNAEWCNTLQAQGFTVVDLPLMTIEPVAASGEVQAVKSLILAFDEYQKVIFVSQNAVYEAFSWLEDYWPQLPVGIEYFAVGKRTAEAVVECGSNIGLSLDVVACHVAMNSDELLAMADFDDVSNEKVLVFRGVGGLPRLGEVLQDRGAVVRYCELYNRCLPTSVIDSAQQPLNELSSRDIVVLFSGETLQNFVMVLGANGCVVRDMVLVVPGERVAGLARSLGFTSVVMAVNASADVMLEAVESYIAGSKF